MRKKKILFNSLVLPLIGIFTIFLSCENQEDDRIAEMQEVHFSIGGETKSTQVGMFDEGDLIGVFAVEHSETGLGSSSNILFSNLQYRFDGNEFRPAPGVDPIRFNGKKMDFYVYAPYSAENNDIRDIRACAVDQDTENGWKISDFVTAVNNTGISKGIVPLHFFHKFATVRLNVEEIPGITGALINSVKTDAVLDFAVNRANVSGTATSLKMFPCGKINGILTYEVTIPEQNTEIGELFTLKKEVGAVKCMSDTEKGLKEGNITPFGINLMMDVSFGEYPAYQGVVTGDGKYVFNSSCTISALPSKGYHFAGWFENGTKVSDNANYSFSVLQDRMFTPAFASDTTYSAWRVTVSANPTMIGRDGGNSTITAQAERDIFIYGVKTGIEKATPALTIDNGTFTLNGNILSVGKNSTSTQRSCLITASIDGATASCTVSQEAGIVITYEYVFYIYNAYLNVGFGSGSHTAQIVSYKTKHINGVSTEVNEDVGYSLWSCSTSWIIAGDGPSFSWVANPTKEVRQGYVTWQQNESGKTDYVQITQDGIGPVITTEISYEISITPTSYIFASTGGSKSFTVNCTMVTKTFADGVLTNTDRTACYSYSTSVSGVGFSCSGTTVTASKNNSTSPRQGSFTVSINGYSVSASLGQEGAFNIDTEV